MAIPVYLFNGFLESGKTKFIMDTLLDPGFTSGERTLIVACEEGEEEYTDEFLEEANSTVLYIDSKEDFKGAKLKKAVMAEKPDRVVVEYNGMWEITLIEQEFPRDWELYQIITTINAETYEVYLKNMGPKIIEHVSVSELVVFNRCTPELNEFIRSSNVRAMNPRAVVFLENVNGEAEDYSDGLPLPYDPESDFIEIADEDFGILFMEAMNNPRKYKGKTFKFKGLLHRREKDPSNRFAAGRFAMVCCAEDISYIAFFCDMDYASEMVDEESWATITAKVENEFYPELGEESIILKVIDFEKAERPKEDLIYFR